MSEKPIIEITIEQGGHTAEVTTTTFKRDGDGVPQKVETERSTATVDWSMGPDGRMVPTFTGWMTPKTEAIDPEEVCAL